MPDSRDRVLAAVAAFNRGDLDSYLASYAGDAVIHGLPPDVDPSPAGLRTFLVDLRAGLPDLQVVIEDTVVEGDRVAVRMTYRGTHRASSSGPLRAGGRSSGTASRSAASTRTGAPSSAGSGTTPQRYGRSSRELRSGYRRSRTEPAEMLALYPGRTAKSDRGPAG